MSKRMECRERASRGEHRLGGECPRSRMLRHRTTDPPTRRGVAPPTRRGCACRCCSARSSTTRSRASRAPPATAPGYISTEHRRPAGRRRDLDRDLVERAVHLRGRRWRAGDVREPDAVEREPTSASCSAVAGNSATYSVDDRRRLAGRSASVEAGRSRRRSAERTRWLTQSRRRRDRSGALALGATYRRLADRDGRVRAPACDGLITRQPSAVYVQGLRPRRAAATGQRQRPTAAAHRLPSRRPARAASPSRSDGRQAWWPPPGQDALLAAARRAPAGSASTGWPREQRGHRS